MIKKEKLQKNKGRGRVFCFLLFCLITFSQLNVHAQSNTPLRRPISPSSPAWVVHIDTWIYPDPKKCIELIPEDIRPFVIMNISLSVSDFVRGNYPLSIAESWLRTCAEYGVWATIQPSSGGPNNFPDYSIETYEYFFANYPNFLGFNFAEQSWGFNDPSASLVTFGERVALFEQLLKLSNKYGGQLFVSLTLTMNAPRWNALGMLKLYPSFGKATRTYKDNYVLFEKYTMSKGFYDIESTSLGAYLSGHCGNYGIRFDETGWQESNGKFPEVTGAIPILEHFMLTGETVTDGPELTWLQTLKNDGKVPGTDGYTTKRFTTFPQFHSASIDPFRKILDGSVRIPTKEEVIARTKIAIVNDGTTGNERDKYSSEKSLFTGLYSIDGEWDDNLTWLKKSGRYPAIPTIYKEGSVETGAFEKIVKKTEYSTRWPSIQAKVDEFNNIFPEEYTGDIYAGRMNNTWMTYNPKIGNNNRATGSIPFKYNTCDKIELDYGNYTLGVINEFSNKVNIYLNNYRSDISSLTKDYIKIYGCLSEPTYKYKYRGDRNDHSVAKEWDAANKVFTLIVDHNGPLDIFVDCAGTNTTNRLSDSQIPKAEIIKPALPPVYTGPRQYEAENFDFKNIKSVDETAARNYTAMGYLSFGNNESASVRAYVTALRTKTYRIRTKYSAPDQDINTVDLYVNGNKVTTPKFPKTSSKDSWSVNVQNIELKAGNNIIEFKANSAAPGGFFLDNIIIDEGRSNTYDFSNDVAATKPSTPSAELITTRSGSAGVISYTDANKKTSNVFKAYSAGTKNSTGVADLDLFSTMATDYSVVWKGYYDGAGNKNGVLLRGTGESSFAEGMKQGYLFVAENNNDNTISLKSYIAGATDITLKEEYKSNFKIAAGKPCWYRATSVNDKLIFECSTDSINWEGAEGTTYTDNAYATGSTQLVWGVNSDNFSGMVGNITYSAINMTISNYLLDGFTYVRTFGPSATKSFIVSGNSLPDNVVIKAPLNFEISLRENNNFRSSLTLSPNNGTVDPTTIYVRLKAKLSKDQYSGAVSIECGPLPVYNVQLTGEVYPKPANPITLTYDFSEDVAKTEPTTPPAANITIGEGNAATAGVVSYTDVNALTSNVLKPYKTGQRNGTGVMNLDLFPKKATDYSVTWKQYVSKAESYKIGMLLRADDSMIGDNTNGYVQGIKKGYYLSVYKNAGASNTEFRVYKSTGKFNELWMQRNVTVDHLNQLVNHPAWFRASVSGKAFTELKIEYSLDGKNWSEGVKFIDNEHPYESGGTQIVWGLSSNATDFYLDDIIFDGVPSEYDDNTEDPESSDASIHALTVNGDDWYLEDRYIIGCDNMADKVVVKVETEDNAKVYRNGALVESKEFTVDIDKPSLRTIAFTIESQDGTSVVDYDFMIEKYFTFQDIVIQRWDNTLLINNNSDTNGGWTFNSVKWFKNDSRVGTGQYYSAGSKASDLLDSNAQYHVQVVTDKREVLRSCPARVTLNNIEMKVYPTVVNTGGTVTVDMGVEKSKLQNAQIDIYNTSGILSATRKVNDKISTIQAPNTSGAYIMHIKSGNIEKSFRLIVK